MKFMKYNEWTTFMTYNGKMTSKHIINRWHSYHTRIDDIHGIQWMNNIHDIQWMDNIHEIHDIHDIQLMDDYHGIQWIE